MLRAEGPPAWLAETQPLVGAERRPVPVVGEPDGSAWAEVRADGSGVVATARDAHAVDAAGRAHVDRVARYLVGRPGETLRRRARRAVDEAASAGFDRLLAEQREAWASRWDDADIEVTGDERLTREIRFALFHLMASAANDGGPAAVGARGLTGEAYRGHVFWDTDVFVLPFLAATCPSAARAVLQYRIDSLDAARENARRLRRAGARFAWESAAHGVDVTPASVRDGEGRLVPIRTGTHEEHIVADVAWAAQTYVDWTGDEEFARGPARLLLAETARYWASRVRLDRAGRAHLYGVVGPDEYHEPVDDNAFTNVMARWNLRAAAALDGADPAESDRWLEIADALVDGYDPESGLYEQFAGFRRLEPIVVSELADRPFTADTLLGRERVRGGQVVKQADVLMLHHLVPQAVAPGSLEPNLAFYEPRTAHGSSLSPGIHASLFARAGRLEDAVHWFRRAARLDLDDLTRTTAHGIHMATLGSVWQAVAFGFAGVRPDGDALTVDPHVPQAWGALDLRVRFRGRRVRLHLEPDAVTAWSDGPTRLRVAGSPIEAGPDGVTVALS